jgi:peptidoglycan hydrolase CwlO-like protein
VIDDMQQQLHKQHNAIWSQNVEIEKLWKRIGELEKKIEELEKRGGDDGMSVAETLRGDSDV